MLLIASQLTADDVLRAYRHDEPLLFLSAAFITVAIIAAAFSFIRRRFDPLLGWFALFAYLYGQRLWLDSEISNIGVHHSQFFIRMQSALNCLVSIPAFAFFEQAGFLGRKSKYVVVALSAVFLSLVIATFVFGPHRQIDQINQIVVILAIPAVAVRSHFMRSRDPDFAIIRIGLLCFILPVIWDNIRNFWTHSKTEPYGFAILLVSLGYVAARRTLRRDQELGEMRSELDLARRIQLSILPAAFPESAYFRVAARYVPMNSVAGDFYDFLEVDATSAGILIADVSGHGVPAALIASMVKMAATSQRENATNPAKLLAGMNTALCGNTQDQSVTAAYVHLDAQAHEFRYAAAGHPPMLLLRKGQITEIIENGLILAISESATFTQLTHSLKPDDRLILYTDGIIEARDAQRKFFGEDNLNKIVLMTAAESPAEAANQILTKVGQWSKSQDDDLTVIVCDYCSAL
jgi:phosphoserine phosphatase RsbU/P